LFAKLGLRCAPNSRNAGAEGGKVTVPAKVCELLERFDSNREAYLSNYNETQVRGDFIAPFLEELGWDVHIRQGHPEVYRRVIEEDKLKMGGGTRAPDYGFCMGGARKFFLEAKKPSVDIAGDVAPAVQLRRYAWSAQLPLSRISERWSVSQRSLGTTSPVTGNPNLRLP
jgi:hypothetical protein